jgi:hypothetical protein
MNHVFANTTVGISSKQFSDVFSEPNEFLRFASLVVSNQRKSKNQLKDNFIDHKVQNGWTVLNIEDKDLASKGKDFELLGFELEEKHYIEWIELHDDETVYRKFLQPMQKPERLSQIKFFLIWH